MTRTQQRQDKRQNRAALNLLLSDYDPILHEACRQVEIPYKPRPVSSSATAAEAFRDADGKDLPQSWDFYEMSCAIGQKLPDAALFGQGTPLEQRRANGRPL